MRAWQWAGLVVVGLFGVTGCHTTVIGATGGNGGNGGAGGQGGSGGQGGGTGTCLSKAPQSHRASAPPCLASTPAITCNTDADCAMSPDQGLPGKCVPSPAGKLCDFNQCTTDADCKTGMTTACSCQGQTFGFAHKSDGATCVPGNCHTDSDCGANGYCSPTVDSSCGSFYGVQGYYCHTCADTCVDDSDCGGTGYCAYDAALGHWACENGGCAG